MSFKIEYASRRGEIWNWYWRAWRKRLWKTHLLTFLAVGVAAMAGLSAKGRGTISPTSFLVAPAFGLLSILWMPIYPQLRFNPQVRSLKVDQCFQGCPEQSRSFRYTGKLLGLTY